MSRRCTAWATASPRTEGHEPPPPLADGAPRGDDGDDHDRRRRAVDDARLPLPRRAPEPPRRRARRELRGARRRDRRVALRRRLVEPVARRARRALPYGRLRHHRHRPRGPAADRDGGRRRPETGAAVRPPRWTATAPVVVRGRPVAELELRPIRSDIFGSENHALRHQLNGLLEVCACLALGLALLAAAMIAATLVRPLRRLTETAERMRG